MASIPFLLVVHNSPNYIIQAREDLSIPSFEKVARDVALGQTQLPPLLTSMPSSPGRPLGQTSSRAARAAGVECTFTLDTHRAVWYDEIDGVAR